MRLVAATNKDLLSEVNQGRFRLENVIERSVLVAEGDVIHPHHLFNIDNLAQAGTASAILRLDV